MIFGIFVEGPLYLPNYFQIGPVVFDKKIVNFFLLVAKEMKALNNIDRCPSKDHSCTLFGKILPSSLGGDG